VFPREKIPFFVLYLKDFFQSKEKHTNWYVF